MTIKHESMSPLWWFAGKLHIRTLLQIITVAMYRYDANGDDGHVGSVENEGRQWQRRLMSAAAAAEEEEL